MPVLARAQPRVFLLSPAYSGGKRAGLVLNDRAEFDLAVRIRREGAPLGDVYSFLSGLYFRGKIEYARAFAAPPAGVPAALVITPGRGLLPPETLITIEDLRQISAVAIDVDDPRYRAPLERDVRRMDALAGGDCRYVLLGSLATDKYTGPLMEILGERLLFPEEFVGRGDMSRGGLMLRCSSDGTELNYVPAPGAVRHGQRPPKLAPKPAKRKPTPAPGQTQPGFDTALRPDRGPTTGSPD